jgi:hypothetical protein
VEVSVTNLLFVSEDWRPPAALDRPQFAIAAATGLAHMLEFVRQHPVDVVLVDKRAWNVSANTMSRWIKSVRGSVRIILLSDQLLLPYGMLGQVDAVISKEAPAERFSETIAAVLPLPEC